MPKNNRFGDTVDFIRQQGGSGVRYANAVADLLDSFRGAIPPSVDEAMHMGSSGTDTTRKYRRGMVLMLTVLNNTPAARAREAQRLVPDAGLPAAFAQMLQDAASIYGGRTLTPIAQQLMNQPTAFLTNNRVKLGRGSMTTSGATSYDLSFDPLANVYFFEPPNPVHSYVHASVPGFNIHVQKYKDVKDSLHSLAALPVTGDLALTTQLSGCTIVYKVAGAQLSVAHINPDADVRLHLPADLTTIAGQPVGVMQTHRLARDANITGAGTLGLFGMVASAAETGLRLLGPRRVRTHGYSDTLGNAYFLGIRSGGNWTLFAQQNNPNAPGAGVSNFMQLYP